MKDIRICFNQFYCKTPQHTSIFFQFVVYLKDVKLKTTFLRLDNNGKQSLDIHDVAFYPHCIKRRCI